MRAVILRAVDSLSNEAAAAFRDSHIGLGALVHTDGTLAFQVFGEGGHSHVATVTGGKRPERERGGPFFNVNSLISKPSTAPKATHKVFSPKHRPDHLGAFCWTTNRRRNMRGMIGALCGAAARTSRLTRRTVYAYRNDWLISGYRFQAFAEWFSPERGCNGHREENAVTNWDRCAVLDFRSVSYYQVRKGVACCAVRPGFRSQATVGLPHRAGKWKVGGGAGNGQVKADKQRIPVQAGDAKITAGTPEAARTMIRILLVKWRGACGQRSGLSGMVDV